MQLPIQYLHGHKVFKDKAEAEALIAGWPKEEYRVNVDPKSGRAIIECLEVETGEVIGLL